MPQFSKYCTLLKFSVCVSPLVFITQIIVFLPKLSGVTSPLTILINGRDTGTYIPVLKSLINLAIWVSALVLNSVPFCLICDQFFFFRYTQRYPNSFFANMRVSLLSKLLRALLLSKELLLDSSFLFLLPDFFLLGS